MQGCVGAYVQEYERTWNALTKPYPGVPEMLDALVVGVLKLAVLSNGTSINGRGINAGLGLMF